MASACSASVLAFEGACLAGSASELLLCLCMQQAVFLSHLFSRVYIGGIAIQSEIE